MEREPTSSSNVTDRIMAFEEGEMEIEYIPEFFQYLIDTGMAWKLQGFYGRQAMALIKDGICHSR